MKQNRVYKVITIEEDPDIMEINHGAVYLMKNYAKEVAESSDRSYTAYKYRLFGLVNAIYIYDRPIYAHIIRDDHVTIVEVYKSDCATKLLVVTSRREDTNK